MIRTLIRLRSSAIFQLLNQHPSSEAGSLRPMSCVYRIYDLIVSSTQHLFYLTSGSESCTADVHITFVENRPEQRPVDGFFYFWQPSDGGLGFWTRLSQGYAEYTISPDGLAITVAYSEQAPFLEVMRYLLGVSLGAALRFRGVLCLHASAVLVNDTALIFAGPSHTGKSSLSAAFHRRGYCLISEDVVALDQRDDGVFVRPGYAGIRLYPDALDYLYGSDIVAEALPVDRKLLYQLDAIPAAACPIQALYLLAPRNPDLSQPRMARINQTSALLALTGQLYLHHFAGQRWLARDFPRLGRLVQRVPVYVLERTDSLSDLDATVDLILEQHAVS